MFRMVPGIIGTVCLINEYGILKILNPLYETIRKPSRDRRGRKYVQIGGRTYFIHRLVALVFIPNPHNYRFVEFIHDNPDNTYYKNLRWTPRIKQPANRKPVLLNKRDVKRIKSMLAAGKSQRVIAARFKVHNSLISHIAAGRRWKNV